jgi:hypothetical protein
LTPGPKEVWSQNDGRLSDFPVASRGPELIQRFCNARTEIELILNLILGIQNKARQILLAPVPVPVSADNENIAA